MIRRVAMVAGVLLLVVPPAAWYLGRPAADVGAIPAPATEVPADEAATPPSPTGPTAPPVAVRSGLLSAQPDPAAPPSRLRIPGIGVDAPVVPVGVDGAGVLEVPEDVREIGWYRHGPAPGGAGSTVLAGHVDSRTQGRGALFDLRDLVPGDRLEVVTDGEVTTWTVEARRAYDKDVVPLEDLFRRDGPARLVVITCGGEFDRRGGSYRQNIVVYARPDR